jgi:hypothetical protein
MKNAPICAILKSLSNKLCPVCLNISSWMTKSSNRKQLPSPKNPNTPIHLKTKIEAETETEIETETVRANQITGVKTIEAATGQTQGIAKTVIISNTGRQF